MLHVGMLVTFSTLSKLVLCKNADFRDLTQLLQYSLLIFQDYCFMISMAVVVSWVILDFTPAKWDQHGSKS